LFHRFVIVGARQAGNTTATKNGLISGLPRPERIHLTNRGEAVGDEVLGKRLTPCPTNQGEAVGDEVLGKRLTPCPTNQGEAVGDEIWVNG
jgi:hypothetical protein